MGARLPRRREAGLRRLHDGHPRSAGRGDAVRGVFDGDAVARRDVELSRRVQVDVGRGLVGARFRRGDDEREVALLRLEGTSLRRSLR